METIFLKIDFCSLTGTLKLGQRCHRGTPTSGLQLKAQLSVGSPFPIPSQPGRPREEGDKLPLWTEEVHGPLGHAQSATSSSFSGVTLCLLDTV